MSKQAAEEQKSSWWHQKFRSVSERRLEAAIRILQAEIDAQKTDQNSDTAVLASEKKTSTQDPLSHDHSLTNRSTPDNSSTTVVLSLPLNKSHTSVTAKPDDIIVGVDGLAAGATGLLAFKVKLDVALPADVSRVHITATIGSDSTPVQSATGLSNARWQELSQQYLCKANKALDNHDPELGWPLFKAAYRAHLYRVTDLQSEANTILREAKDEKKKLSSWRKESIIGLLSADEGKTVKPSLKPEAVVKAQLLLDEQMDNTYYKSAIVKNRLQLLGWTSLIILIIWVIFAPPISGPNPSIGEGVLTAPATPIIEAPTLANLVAQSMMPSQLFWLSLILAGMVGAAISGFTGAIQQDVSKSRIPDELSISTVTFARLGLAGVSAVAISLFLTSGLIAGSNLSYELLLASAVAAGFSEQFLMRALEPKA